MKYRTIFTDVGGVLLNNGWDKSVRHAAADHFGIDREEMQQRHEMVFEDYERGKLLLEEYLKHVVFFKPRQFTLNQFVDYMFDTSFAYPEMIDLIKTLKGRHQLKVATLSNEGREIAVNRFKRFKFNDFIDYYIVSGFAGVRKPDLRIYELAIGLCQEEVENIVYLDDRLPLIKIAEGMGFKAIHHTNFKDTQRIMDSLFSK